MNEVEANTGLIFDKLDSWLDGLFRLLPNIAVAVVFMVVFWGLSLLARRVVRHTARARGRHSLGEVAGALARWAIVIAGAMLAITIGAPTSTPGALIAGLGVSSVAIGFAFKDILQNMLAGILILLRQPFEVGDQIVSGGHEGTVEEIETRATFLRTYDGRRVVIPNSDIYTESVIVNTAFEFRRSEYEIGIGCNDDWDKARRIMEKACASVPGVIADPPPETIPVLLGDFANVVRLRWWTKSRRADQLLCSARSFKPSIWRWTARGSTCPIRPRSTCSTTRPKKPMATACPSAKDGPPGAARPQIARSGARRTPGRAKADRHLTQSSVGSR